jgi:hypothetical protein
MNRGSIIGGLGRPGLVELAAGCLQIQCFLRRINKPNVTVWH